ncbi:helix-turn-helix transcriptional regulator [Streptomyces sp. SID13031]|uniref:helix-turn-helix transcriptional regulator n=1 Tax=Streptomyces sp. SID13031 TaxID=2706046 RepID=UPI0013CA9C41|nr:helix-turn-helix transcriptional regulator [Streptomyces sp. SID13031]NEA31833.1 helix-turn-helix domain-containing protein [Streptomyces sp. SID13031]
MDRRDELTEFLKSRRARVRPEDLGLKVFPGRRRVPGLRREELAQVAGVSADYYVRLEQGRTENVSQEILDAVAEVLGLDEAEREHLTRLARPARRPKARRTTQRVRPGVRQLLNSLETVPAFLLGHRMDVLAWNRLAAAVVGDFAQLPPRERNLPRRVFLDESARDLYPQWEAMAVESVGYLRLYAGRYPDDPELAELVGELSIHSAEFRKQWARHDVRDKSFGVKELQHPLVGPLSLQYETLLLPGDPDQTILTFSAVPGSESEAALRLLASWTSPAPEPADREKSRFPQPAPELP